MDASYNEQLRLLFFLHITKHLVMKTINGILHIDLTKMDETRVIAILQNNGISYAHFPNAKEITVSNKIMITRALLTPLLQQPAINTDNIDPIFGNIIQSLIK